MQNVIIETIASIVAALATTLIGVFGAWLLAKISKREELKTIAIGVNEVINAAQITVMELQQTLVDGMKAAAEDGKLGKDDIAALGLMLERGAMEKLSEPTKTLLEAAGVDIIAIIHGAGEALIRQINDNK